MCVGCVTVPPVDVSCVMSHVVPVTEPWRTQVGGDSWGLSDPTFSSKATAVFLEMFSQSLNVCKDEG